MGLAATSPLATATTWQVSSNSSNEVTVLQNFNFGTLVISGPGTVRISPEGVLTTTGGVNSAGGFPQAAILRLNSHPGNTYTLDLPSSVTLTSAGGGAMLLRNFTFNPAAVGSMHSSKQEVTVGATLQVSSNQAGGAYRGNIDVVVSYD